MTTSKGGPAIARITAARAMSVPASQAIGAAGWIDYAGWLSDEILVVVGWFRVEEGSVPDVVLRQGDRSETLESRCLSFLRPDVPDVNRAGKLLTARLPRGSAEQGTLGRLVIRTGGKTLLLGPGELSKTIVDLRSLALGGLAALDPGSRMEVMEFLVGAEVDHGLVHRSRRTSRRLSSIREILRERHPLCVIARDRPQGLHVDELAAISELSFFIRGWMRDTESQITRLVATSPEGSRAELLDRAYCSKRPDVDQFYGVESHARLNATTGFTTYFELRAPSRLETGWTVEMHNSEGASSEVAAPPVIQDPIAARNIVLGKLAYERVPDQRLMEDHVHPAISQLQERLRDMVEVEDVVQYGTEPTSPEVSIVVLLYGRTDFLVQQLSQFVHDPEIVRSDLIYVLDSPELASGLRESAEQLYRLYRVPFRLVTLKRNVGFSHANNTGASLARGRLLLLMNSDILPARPGWLGTMRTFYDATPGIGALGPKLLYEDDSLQHAGVYFLRQPGATIWENMHYFKGLHRSLPAANVARPVPAVTGAFFMIDTQLYRDLGGLRGIYVQGDYEDTDLCLRLLEAGRENWYLPAAELYHLEGQSYPSALRQVTSKYNAWLHTQFWEKRIDEMTTEFGDFQFAAAVGQVHGTNGQVTFGQARD